MSLKNALPGLAAAALFSLLYGLGVFEPLEDRVYDFFLRFRADRERTQSVVFLDVDDDAIAYNGEFPWPRSIAADGLLRLKEYGARAAIFDIEFIDRGPQGVDSLYLNQGLPADFSRSFDEIKVAAQDMLSALRAGRIGRNEIDGYAQELSELISDERDSLFIRAQSIARDNDLYLAQAIALFGNSWLTLNLRPDTLRGEQAERRLLAEERFSYPVKAASQARTGEGFEDILPALPVFSSAAQGAGFTNVVIDSDGVRRRIFLSQKIGDYWYLQLVFAPLINYLGSPEIKLEPASLLIKGAVFPGDGTVSQPRDIRIPLDSNGCMMLDWSPADYEHSYGHISFAKISQLEDIEEEIEQYIRALGSIDMPFFAQFDSSFSGAIRIVNELGWLFDAIAIERVRALETCSDESFAAYMEYRAQSRELIHRLLAFGIGEKAQAMVQQLSAAYPENAGDIDHEAEDIATLLEYLKIDSDRYEDISLEIAAGVKDKFCILGRVDTGTTDYGANPFHNKYVNVGTHGVVLDMILSEVFIIPLGRWWSILFMLIFMPAFFFLSAGREPVLRAIMGFAVTALIAIGSVLLFRFAGVYFFTLGTVFAMISAVVVREIISYAGSEREKRFIRKAFSTYVSDDVVKEIIADPSRLQLGGTKRHMTAIFTDVQGFTSISEKLDAESLVSLLNRYLTALSDVILSEKGTIDKYEGDAIIAFFGAPLDLPDHALRACISAIALKRAERELNKAILEEKLSPAPLLTRIGINTGAMVAGNMGTKEKMNYTIMGNTVNLASRLEGVNKQYGTWIMASESTVKETGDRILARRLDRVRVVGISEPVRLYELLETVENASPEQQKLVTVFHEALGCFEARDWKRALGGFTEALILEYPGGPTKRYMNRCEQFLKKPPADEWDGVYNLTEK
jgi:adenylate cyclase